MPTSTLTTYRTAESVSPKHPDKLCDQISDAVLDAYLEQDAHARVAVDVAGGHGQVFVTGEVTSGATVDIEQIVHRIAGDVTVIPISRSRVQKLPKASILVVPEIKVL